MTMVELILHVLWRCPLEVWNMVSLLFEWGEITSSICISGVNKIVFDCKKKKTLVQKNNISEQTIIFFV
jgi:hypothetical protein